MGPRPVRHEHRSRCEVDAGSRNPEELFLRLCFGRAVFAVCAPQNGAYNKAPPLRFWSGGALLVRFYSRKAVCGIGDWDISARAFRLSLSGGAKQGDTGL